MSDWHYILPFVRGRKNGRFVLASLVKVEGSSYRPIGARLLIAEDGAYSGMLSGGCLEDGIAAKVGEILEQGVCRLIKIDTRPHFGCPGILHVLLEPLTESRLLEQISALVLQRKNFRVATSATSGTRIFGLESVAPDEFVESIEPRRRLIVLGWTPDMNPLLTMAATLGWEIHRIVRDFREADGMPSIAGESLSVCEPERLAEYYAPDDQTAVLLMSHHLSTDLAYLLEIFNRPYAYIGVLGSKRRRETLLAELGERGMLEEPPYMDRFHAPAGLKLGNDHPSEIALAIVAEIQHEFIRVRETSKFLPIDQMAEAIPA